MGPAVIVPSPSLRAGDIVEAFRDRLKSVAGFKYVPDPVPMRNSANADVYYLFFASQQPVAAQIVEGIAKKYRTRGGSGG
jgi:three-Cys-motif partner protein